MGPATTATMLSAIFANVIFAIPVDDIAGIRRPMPGSIGNLPVLSGREASSFLPVPTELPQADCSSPTTPFMVFGHSCSAPTDCDIDGVKIRINEAKMRIAMIDNSPEDIRLAGMELDVNRTVLDCTMRHDKARLETMQHGGLAWCAQDFWVHEHPECSDKALDAYVPDLASTHSKPVTEGKNVDERNLRKDSRIDPTTFHGVDPDAALGDEFALQEEQDEQQNVEPRPRIKTATTTHSPNRGGMTEIPSHLLPHHPYPTPTYKPTKTKLSRTHDGSSTSSAARLHIHTLKSPTFTTLPPTTHLSHTSSHALKPRQELRDFTGKVIPSGYTVLPITFEGKEYTTFCEICALRYGDRVSRGAGRGGQLLFAEDNGYPWPKEQECKKGCERSCNVLGICTGGPFHPFPTDPALREKLGFPPL